MSREKVSKRKSGGIIVNHSWMILEELHTDKGYVMVDRRMVCSGPPIGILD
ncbi:MAG: hypothetical protein ABIN61_00115 [candidate division WOR-3 bacterium]